MQPDGSEIVVVLCTVPDRETALRLAHLAVDASVAACANIVPGLTSVYRWQGSVHEDPELLLLLKTPTGRFEQLRALLVEAHPYDVPEIIAVPVTGGHAPYLAWVVGATGAA